MKKVIRGDHWLWRFSINLKWSSVKTLSSQTWDFEVTYYEYELGSSSLWAGLSDSELGFRGPCGSLLEPLNCVFESQLILCNWISINSISQHLWRTSLWLEGPLVVANIMYLQGIFHPKASWNNCTWDSSPITAMPSFPFWKVPLV